MENYFSNKDNNIRILEGCYRKLKSYYYYNKNFILIKKKIALFESDNELMVSTFQQLSSYLCNPDKDSAQRYMFSLLDQISYYVLPKKFEEKEINFDSNEIAGIKLRDVNFFINAPIEIHILDVLWTLLLGKIGKDRNLLSEKHLYGNVFVKNLFSNGVDFDSIFLFSKYFKKYSAWRDGAFTAMQNNLLKKRNSLMVSVDFQRYFYTIGISSDYLASKFGSHPLYKSLQNLNELFVSIYETYSNQIIKSFPHVYEKVFLPIGFFSSMYLGNVFLADLDKKIVKKKNLLFYGRYVDDILIVFDVEQEKKENCSFDTILSSKLADCFYANGAVISLKNNSSLNIQKEKLKTFFVKWNSSSAVFDYYDEFVRAKPSQVSLYPDDVDFDEFEEKVYSFGKFQSTKKIKDLGPINTDAYWMSVFFSKLLRRCKNLNQISKDEKKKILRLFKSKKVLEYYLLWPSFLYFLVLLKDAKQIRLFYSFAKNAISKISLRSTPFRKSDVLKDRLVVSLTLHLEVCLAQAFALDGDLAKNDFSFLENDIRSFFKSNIFKHELVSVPLSNYLEWDSFVDLSAGQFSSMKSAFLQMKGDPLTFEKFDWSPRFVHIHEIQMLNFCYLYFKNEKVTYDAEHFDKLIEVYRIINRIKVVVDNPVVISDVKHGFSEYKMSRVLFNSPGEVPSKILLAVGNVKLSLDDISPFDKMRKKSDSEYLTETRFRDLNQILKSMSVALNSLSDTDCCRILVLPELFLPVSWIPLIFNYALKNKIAVVTGLQYLEGEGNLYKNCLMSVFPYSFDSIHENLFCTIREKNDYSPIEFDELGQHSCSCKNASIATYQVYSWNGLDVAPMMCYELTDVVPRALLKGRCDVVLAPVFNKDTAYFSSIIESSVRDLHAVFVQANTSFYGDSRVTAPYSKDERDIIKIKGGENASSIIGLFDFEEIVNYQKQCTSSFSPKVRKIKRLPARFKNKRVD